MNLKNKIKAVLSDLIKGTSYEAQEGGAHYKALPIQPALYADLNELNSNEANVVKYVTRHRSKNGVEDLKKAQHYLQMIIDLEYANNEQ